MKKMEASSVDCIVTDPPYRINMMLSPKIKFDDEKIPQIEIWEECLRVLKPGGFAFIMCASRSDKMAELINELSEVGFVTKFTPIFWTYACLSEDTEILTKDGWTQLRTSNKYINKEILIYNSETDNYKWEIPNRWHNYSIKDTCYRIKSDFTERILVRNVFGIPFFFLSTGLYSYNAEKDSIVFNKKTNKGFAGQSKYIFSQNNITWIFNEYKWSSLHELSK